MYVNLSIALLTDLKVRALRRRVWFKVLTPLERSILNLTLKIVEKVRSRFLAKILCRIADKLNEALKSGVERLMETAGRALAKKIAAIAVSWGNIAAFEWAFDEDFVKFLTINELNRPFCCRHVNAFSPSCSS
jgi:hypothetical protein